MMKGRIVLLTRALEQAGTDENWDEIRRIDAQISQLLDAIRQQGLQETLRPDLAPLYRCHQWVAKMCREQHDVLQLKVQQYQQNRQGLQAYELFSESDEENE